MAERILRRPTVRHGGIDRLRFVLAVAALAAGLQAEDQANPPLPIFKRTTAATIGAYAVEIVHPVDPADESELGPDTFEIKRDGRVLWARSGFRFTIGGNFFGGRRQDSDVSLLQPGACFLGGKTPCLVVEEWTGGAHCCYDLHLYRLGDEVECLDTIQLHHGGWDVVDLDGDGCAEIRTYDWTFAYWYACFASSPAPEVVLRYDADHRRFVPAPDLMKRDVPSPQTLKQSADRVFAFLSQHPRAPGAREIEFAMDEIAHDLWGTMLDLMYSGHQAQAVSFLDSAWPPEIEGKAPFLDNFRSQAAKSPWWPAIAVAFDDRAP